MLDVALLGTGGMMPMPNRFLTSLLLRYNGKMILIDCGEGTQVSLKMLGWGFKAIEAILFTHYHADHISGLPGMLLTIGNSGRTEPLKLIGPKGLIEIVSGLKMIAPELPFPIEYIILEEQTEEITLFDFHISWLFVEHIMRCAAYRVDIKRKGAFDVERARKQNIPKDVWSKLQKQGQAELNGIVYTADMVLGPSRKGISVCYCTDSRPTAALPEFVYQSDLLVCEGMYGDDSKKEKAVQNKHMLFSEAAEIAKKGQVSSLWLTHYSPAMKEPEEYHQVAANIFPQTILGTDRMTQTLSFENNF